jgi:hypothetical protein
LLLLLMGVGFVRGRGLARGLGSAFARQGTAKIGVNVGGIFALCRRIWRRVKLRKKGAMMNMLLHG